VEASALPASVGLARTRVGLGVSLLRLRSDEQLVSLFRAGNEDAFRVIHDRYRTRIHAYARQMLSSAGADAEDVVQEIFVRAYAGLRSNRRDLALRAWLYRIAHNRCIDELRRPQAIAVEAIDELGESPHADPHLRAEQREALRRLIADVQRLPDQQRSALLMRELGGMPYADLSGALGVSVPAVKSLLVRARVGLVQASEARDIDCAAIREDLVVAHDRGVRASGRARRHMRDCSHCRQFRGEVHGVSRRFGLLLPALGPFGMAAKLLGFGALSGGSAAAGSSTGAAAGSTAAAAGSTSVAAGSTAAVAGGGAAVAGGSALAVAGTGHVVTIIAATVVAAGSAIGIQQVSSAPAHHTSRAVQTSTAAAAAGPTRAGVTTIAAVPRATIGEPAPSEGTAPVVSTSAQTTTRDTGGASGRPSTAGGAGTTAGAPRAGFTAGTTSASTAAGSNGPASTTPTAPGTTTPGTSSNPTGTTTTTSAPTTTTGVGDPTSTLPATTTPETTSGTGAPASTTTTPGSAAPTSTSAATTTAHRGRASGGSTLLPVLKVTRARAVTVHGHRAATAYSGQAGLTGSQVTAR
jgi:RNA polymerase sigma factor (sigma-70 family)